MTDSDEGEVGDPAADDASRAREAFLAGERPDEILLYLREDGVGDPDALADLGERTDDGVVLVMPGPQGREAFESATGLDPMDFAGVAMGTEGRIDRDGTGGTCPEGEGPEHVVKFVFAFAEAQNEEVGGLYAEGDVIHGYAACSCGTTYTEKWVAGEEA
jgi:hypothetical protein